MRGTRGPGRPQKLERETDPIKQIPVALSVKQRLSGIKRTMNAGRKLKMTFGDVIVALLDGALGAHKEGNGTTPGHY